MRKISKEILLKPQEKDFMLRQKAYPFPGKAPTRVYMSVKLGAKKFEYIGKPNRIAANTFEKLLIGRYKHLKWSVQSIEFDRKGYVSFLLLNDMAVNVSKVNNKLWGIYHPDVMPTTFPNWIGYRTTVHNHAYYIGDGWKIRKVKNAVL